MNKLNICGMTGSGKLQDLKELLEPLWPYYDALNWTFHYPKDEGADYLESIKKDGKIIYTDFCYRHDFSRDHYFYQGTMNNGDFFFEIDDQERLLPVFFEKWPQLKLLLESNSIDGVLLYGKRFLYKYNDYMRHVGSPHESVIGCNKVIELTNIEGYKDTSWFWGSVRAQKREKFQYVFHFLNYYVNHPVSNHCLLGLDRYSDREEIFQIRENIRRQFRWFCQRLNMLPLTIEKFKILCNEHFEEMKFFINSEKIINDSYQYFVLNNENLGDAHDLNTIIKI